MRRAGVSPAGSGRLARSLVLGGGGISRRARRSATAGETPALRCLVLVIVAVLPHLPPQLAEGLSPVSAVMLATRIFYNYFTVEILFGVRDHFGKETDAAVHEISRILRHGMLRGSDER